MADDIITQYFIQGVVMGPIYTVSTFGFRAVKCYPDVRTAVINGKQTGYSRIERTLIVPPYTSEDDISIYKTI